jgi:hypothetical protein
LAVTISGPLSPSDVALRAAARARGTDRATAVSIGRALLANPLPAQLVQIRCERAGNHRICGLVVSGVKFKRPLDRQAFLAEVRALIEGAFSHAALEEVDLWTTVPLSAGKGVVVSGDAAVPTAATVFAVTVPRAALAQLDRQLASGRDVYWDPSFADSLAKGTPQ